MSEAGPEDGRGLKSWNREPEGSRASLPRHGPAPSPCSALTSCLTSGPTTMARKAPEALGEGLGWPGPQLSSRPLRRAEPEWHHHGATWPFCQSSPTLDLSRSVPQAWVPRSPYQESSVHSHQASIAHIPDNASILHVLSSRVHTNTHTHACTHTHMHAHTHMHEHTGRADCVL